MSGQTAPTPEFAFYYPGPMWHSSESIKNLLLFFDGISLLVPRYLRDKPERIDPSLAVPLRERGLLKHVEPEEHLDKEATEELAEALTALIADGAIDVLMEDDEAAFHELSMSRLGYYGDPSLAQMLFEELKLRGLARESEDGVSIPMHRTVRALILVLLAQILRPKGEQLGLELIPATDRANLLRALTELLDIPTAPSAGTVVASDLQTVGVDLSLVPLDEVLDFRAQHAREHRAYARTVRRFVRDMSQLSKDERFGALDDRQQEIADLANELRRIHRHSWRRSASFSLGAAGAVWTAVSGDPLGAVLAAAAGLAGAGSTDDQEADAFSYLFALPGGHP